MVNEGKGNVKLSNQLHYQLYPLYGRCTEMEIRQELKNACSK